MTSDHCTTFSLMDRLTFDFEDLHLRVDRGVFELFRRSNHVAIGPYRRR